MARTAQSCQLQVVVSFVAWISASLCSLWPQGWDRCHDRCFYGPLQGWTGAGSSVMVWAMGHRVLPLHDMSCTASCCHHLMLFAVAWQTLQ
jgi:hypothetical protein